MLTFELVNYITVDTLKSINLEKNSIEFFLLEAPGGMPVFTYT